MLSNKISFVANMPITIGSDQYIGTNLYAKFVKQVAQA